MRADNLASLQVNQPRSFALLDGDFAVVDDSGELIFTKNYESVASPLGTGSKSATSDDSLHLIREHLGVIYYHYFDPQNRAFVRAKELEKLENITAIKFVKKSSLFAVGRANGELYIFYENRPYKLLTNTIQPIVAICSNLLFANIVYIDETNKIHVYSLKQNEIKESFKPNLQNKITNTYHLNSKNKIFATLDQGEIVAIDLSSKKIDYFDKKVAITAFYSNATDEIVLLGDSDGKLYTTQEIENGYKLLFLDDFGSKVVSIKEQKGVIFLLLANGDVVEFDHKKRVEKFVEITNKKSLDDFVEFVAEYPLIIYTDEYKRADKILIEAKKEALFYLSKSETKKLTQLAKKLSFDDGFASFVQKLELFASKAQFFADLVDQGKYEQAYITVQTNPLYKELDSYKKLEDIFTKYIRAAMLLLTDKKPDHITARKTLERFAKVSSKVKLIKTLFEMPRLFKTADELIREKHFEAFYTLATKYEILKETNFYAKYEQIAREKEDEARGYFYKKRYSEMIFVYKNILKNFPQSAKKLEPFFKRSEIYQHFENAYLNKSMLIAQNYISRYSFLVNHPYTSKIAKANQDRFAGALYFAYKLEFEAMHKILQPFIKNKNLTKIAIHGYFLYFLEELERHAKTGIVIDFDAVFRRFFERFGYEALLHKLAIKLGKEKEFELARSYEEQGFETKPFISSIFEG